MKKTSEETYGTIASCVVLIGVILLFWILKQVADLSCIIP